MKKIIKEYFNYSKREFKGLVILLLLIIMVFVWPQFYSIFKKHNVVDFDVFKSQIKQFETQIKEKDSVKESILYFVFDPNTVSKTDLLKLGLLKNQAQTLINYRNSGGRFVVPADLMKIYTIDETLYEKLSPYISIKQVKKQKTISRVYDSKDKGDKKYFEIYKNIDPIELNSADSIDLIKLYGVGPVLARRIINYRMLLGGFSESIQLLDVYGLDTVTYSLIESSVIVDTVDVVKINLNTANFKTLNSHPYISYADTKTILKYRELMGSFSSIGVLLENNLVDSLTYNKVKYYVCVK